MVVLAPRASGGGRAPVRRAAKLSSQRPSPSRAPATIAPLSGSRTSPSALTATTAPTGVPSGRRALAQPAGAEEVGLARAGRGAAHVHAAGGPALRQDDGAAGQPDRVGPVPGADARHVGDVVVRFGRRGHAESLLSAVALSTIAGLA